jgi:hypothetical protein
MSNNSWIIPVSAIAIIALGLGLGYNMYSNNKETPSSPNGNSYDPYNNEAFGGRKTKRRKHRKNASKKRR